MANIIKLTSFVLIGILIAGCATNNPIPKKNESLTGGMVDTENKKQRVAKLINSKGDVEKVFNSIVNAQKGDKYESSDEYKKRMENAKINTYAVMDIKIKKHYDPDKQLYTISFDTRKSYPISPTMYKKGELEFNDNTGSSKSPYEETYYLSETIKSSSYKNQQSNAFGATVMVTTYTSTDYDAYLNNFEKVMDRKNFILEEGRYHLHDKYSIAIPANKEKARELDKQKLKLKAGVQFTDVGTSLCKTVGGFNATIDSPIAIYYDKYNFKAHLAELVLYSQDTGEILFQFAD